MVELSTIDYVIIATPFLAYWSMSAAYLTFEKVGLLKGYEIQPGGFTDPKKQIASPLKVFCTVVAQHCAAIGMSIALAEESYPYRQLPDYTTLLFHAVGTMIFIDAWAYWMHRIFHVNRFLYRHLHSWHHEVYAPYCFSGQFNHPIEGFLLDNLSGAIPLFFFKLHPYVACAIFTMATTKNVSDHCGYKIWFDPWQRISGNNTAFHDSHHRLQGLRFNYSQPFFVFWDVVGGTYKEPEKIKVD